WRKCDAVDKIDRQQNTNDRQQVCRYPEHVMLFNLPLAYPRQTARKLQPHCLYGMQLQHGPSTKFLAAPFSSCCVSFSPAPNRESDCRNWQSHQQPSGYHNTQVSLTGLPRYRSEKYQVGCVTKEPQAKTYEEQSSQPHWYANASVKAT